MAMTRELKRDYFAGFSKNAERQLLDYAWPGNVRELKNVVERAVYRTGAEDMIKGIEFDPFASPWRPRTGPTGKPAAADASQAAASMPTSSPSDFPVPFESLVENFEVGLIKGAMLQAQYNQKRTAELLSITYHQLRGLLKKYNLLDNGG